MSTKYFKSNGIAKRFAQSRITDSTKKVAQMEGLGNYIIYHREGDERSVIRGTEEQLKEEWWNLLKQNEDVGGWVLSTEENYRNRNTTDSQTEEWGYKPHADDQQSMGLKPLRD